MAVTSICATRSSVAVWRPNYRQYVVTYKAKTDSVTDGPGTVLQYAFANGLRLLQATYSYGTELDADAILIDITTPRRAGGDKLLTTWIFQATFEFDLESRPEYWGGYRVEPYYVGTQEAVTKAKYRGAYRIVNDTFQREGFPPNQETYTDNKYYPIGNSARVPIIPAIERDKSIPAYRVTWLARRTTNYVDHINTHNVNFFTMESFHRVFTAPGVFTTELAFSRNFVPGQLRLRDVQQPTRLIYGRLWYEVTMEFIEEPLLDYQLDRGLSARARAGDPDGRGGTYSEGDFLSGASSQREITDEDGQPVSDPVLLDGRGQPLRNEEAGAIYLAWEKYPLSNFSFLQLGVID